MSELTDRGVAFRAAIAGFIDARREAKLKGNEGDAAAAAAAKYSYDAWLADAVRRVSQIQAVTHVLKATHPDARGSSLHITPSRLPQRTKSAVTFSAKITWKTWWETPRRWMFSSC